ncbi:tripartite tricarboxylate transporter substrate-binding protein [Geodermatophilus sp. CPCC 205761]|uniref:tripartite tricarboxylate transporter substrate-binding protein n=1 Tax=Geodermatophilus sp. CPCC 205761 TaxID=2936597 RepID=UPI003EF026E2
MAERIYEDFDLLIEPATGSGYRARVLSSPVGETRPVPINIPFSELELDNFLLRIGRPRRSVGRGGGSPEATAVRDFGRRLFDAVFRDQVRSTLATSRNQVEGRDAGLRVRLRLTDCPELADLPWEYLYDGDARRFLALSEWTPVVRYLELPGRIRRLTVQPPLHILVLVSSPTDFYPLDVQAEWARLEEALDDLQRSGRVLLERAPRGTVTELQRRLRRGTYHVFHYIGHGRYDPEAEDGLLALEGPDGRGDPISGADLGALLHDHRTLRMALLNSCEGARGGRSDPYAGTAQSLIYQGIPAVVAMQFEITDRAAIIFTRGFYEAVADGYPLDAAMAEARKAIRHQPNPVEWGTPVLYLRAPDGRIFDLPTGPRDTEDSSQRDSVVSTATDAMPSDDHSLHALRVNDLDGGDLVNSEGSTGATDRIGDGTPSEAGQGEAQSGREDVSPSQPPTTDAPQEPHSLGKIWTAVVDGTVPKSVTTQAAPRPVQDPQERAADSICLAPTGAAAGHGAHDFSDHADSASSPPSVVNTADAQPSNEMRIHREDSGNQAASTSTSAGDLPSNQYDELHPVTGAAEGTHADIGRIRITPGTHQNDASDPESLNLIERSQDTDHQHGIADTPPPRPPAENVVPSREFCSGAPDSGIGPRPGTANLSTDAEQPEKTEHSFPISAVTGHTTSAGQSLPTPKWRRLVIAIIAAGLAAATGLIALNSFNRGAPDEQHASPDHGPVSGLRIMVLNSPGSGYDNVARAVAQVLEDNEQATDIEVFNREGAGGTVGLQQLISETGNADLLMQIGLGVVGAQYSNQSEATLDQTTPIARLIGEAEAIVAPADSPYQSLDQLVQAWKADPGNIPVGGASNPGGPDHLTSMLLAQEVGVEPASVNYVAYDGGGELLAGILGGQVAFGATGVGGVAEHAVGDLRVLAVTSEEPVEGVDAPPLTEQGVDLVLLNWRGIVAAPGISEEDAQRHVDMITEMHDSGTWQQLLEEQGWTDAYISGEKFDSFLDEESQRVQDVLSRLGLA